MSAISEVIFGAKSSHAALEKSVAGMTSEAPEFWHSVTNMEKFIQEHLEEIELKVKHYFTPGLYCREIFMPAGVLVTSKIHKTEHVYIVSKGSVIVATEDGQVTLKAPHTGITKPGTKRALYILEDCIWTTMHATELTDVDEIESEIIAPSYQDYLLFADAQKLLEKQ